MGFSLKKVTKTIKNAVKKPGNVIKKSIAVAEGAAAGFATGGVYGMAAGAATTAVSVSKHGKGPAVTLRSALNYGGKGAVAGAITGVVQYGIGAMGGPGAITKSVTNLGKSGGITGKLLPQITKGFQAFGGINTILPAVFKGKAGATTSGESGGGDGGGSTPSDFMSGVEQAANKAQGFIGKWRGGATVTDETDPNTVQEAPQAAGAPAGGSAGWVAPVLLAGSTLLFM